MDQIDQVRTHESIVESPTDGKMSGDEGNSFHQFEEEAIEQMPERSRLKMFAILVALHVGPAHPLNSRSHSLSYLLAFIVCSSA